MGRAEEIYSRLPRWGQAAAANLYGVYWKWLRFGPGFDEARRGFEQRDRFTAEEWSRWQATKIEAILDLAATRVPYYRGTWTEGQRHAALAGRLREIPLLSKESVRADPGAFLAEGVSGRAAPVTHTSGTTGTPVRNYWTAAEFRSTRALREVRSAGWAGVSFRLPRATISGRLVVPRENAAGPFHQYNAVERQVYFSAFHINARNAPKYVDALWRHEVRWLTGYAVSHYLLARHIVELGLRVPPLRAVITTSEKLTARMREVMTAAFGCRIYEEYGSVENIFLATECSAGSLHVSPDAGVVEILRADGSACEPGESGEVVATGLLRTRQPLVRYRIGDLATWDRRSCPCGRAMPVMSSVVGRIEDVVVSPDGSELVRFHGVFTDQPRVIEGQVIQEALDRITVRVVPAPGFSQQDELGLAARVRERLGSRVVVNVETVEAIPRDAAGKFRAVISLLGKGTEHPGEWTHAK